MKEFIGKYPHRIHGVLSCFDRVIFRGYLPIMSGWAMAAFLGRLNQSHSSLRPFLLQNSERVKNHAVAMAKQLGSAISIPRIQHRQGRGGATTGQARWNPARPGLHLFHSGTLSYVLVCVPQAGRGISGRSFDPAKRKCLHLYFYFMDRHFGLIHVRIQTWFPMPIQIYVNGHEWLARKLAANGARYTKHDNVFLWIDDIARAQKFADRFANLNWPRILGQYAKLVTPQLQDILKDQQHYWVTAQSELSTDILFKSRKHLSELYPELLSHATLCLGAKDVMHFLGRKLRGNFEGEIVSDLTDFAGRIPGCRIKHRVQQNWLKMYDKAGLVLRVETVINNPEVFKVRKKVQRNGKSQVEWVPMRKGVAYLFRYQQVSMQANSRYLEALAVVDDPSQAKRDLERMTTRKKDPAGRGCAAFNPLARRDAELFQSLMDGHHCLRGFANQDIRQRLASHPPFESVCQRSQESQLQSQPHPSPLSRSRIDCQDSAHPPVARYRLRAPRHGHCALSTQS